MSDADRKPPNLSSASATVGAQSVSHTGAASTTAGTASAARHAAGNISIDRSVDPSASGTRIVPAHPAQRAMPGAKMSYVVEGIAPHLTYDWYCINDSKAVAKAGAPSAAAGPCGVTTADPNESRWDVTWAFVGRHTLVFQMYDDQRFTEVRFVENVRPEAECTDDALRNSAPHSLLNQQVGLAVQLQRLKDGGELDQSSPDAPYIAVRGENPMVLKDARGSWANTYSLQNRDKAHATGPRLRWYVRPDDAELLKQPELYGCPRIDVDGHGAFELQSEGESARFRIGTTGGYTIVCEGFDDSGKSTGVLASYRQGVVDAATEKNIAAVEKHARNVDAGVATMRDGAEIPIRAVYWKAELGAEVPLSLYLAPSKSDPQRMVLLDLTPGATRLDYDGVGVEGALDAFERGNAYPNGGHIKIEAPSLTTGGGSIVRELGTYGKSMIGNLGAIASAVSLLDGDALFLAALAGAGASVIMPLMVIAAVAGIVGGVLDLVAQSHVEVVDVKKVSIDLIDIVGGFLELGAITNIIKPVKAAELQNANAAKKALYAIDVGMEASQVLMVEYDNVVQINRVLSDPQLSRGEKIQRIVRILTMGSFAVKKDDIVAARDAQTSANDEPTNAAPVETDKPRTH